MDGITINFKVLENNELSINEFLCLLKIHLSNNGVNMDYEDLYSYYQSLEKKKYIKITVSVINDERKIKYNLREKANLLIKTLFKDDKKVSKKVVNKQLETLVTDNINAYRSLFKPLRRGAMGSPEGCKTKLIRWFSNNPNYTFEDVVNATKLYIKEFNGDYRYLQQADYFIYKKDGKDEMSRLSTYVEELDNNETVDDDWTSNLT